MGINNKTAKAYGIYPPERNTQMTHYDRWPGMTENHTNEYPPEGSHMYVVDQDCMDSTTHIHMVHNPLLINFITPSIVGDAHVYLDRVQAQDLRDKLTTYLESGDDTLDA